MYTFAYICSLMQCDRTTSLDAFFEEVSLDPNDFAVIGCGCSDATEAVAEIVHYWNIPLVGS